MPKDVNFNAYLAKRVSKNNKPYTCLVVEIGEYSFINFPEPFALKYLSGILPCEDLTK